MINIRVMSITDYDGVYNLWNNTPGMGLNSTDDSREGIEKYLKRNPMMGEEDIFIILLCYPHIEIKE